MLMSGTRPIAHAMLLWFTPHPGFPISMYPPRPFAHSFISYHFQSLRLQCLLTVLDFPSFFSLSGFNAYWLLLNLPPCVVSVCSVGVREVLGLCSVRFFLVASYSPLTIQLSQNIKHCKWCQYVSPSNIPAGHVGPTYIWFTARFPNIHVSCFALKWWAVNGYERYIFKYI